MEKKSTRTAYLVAVCAIIVLLVILAMSYKNAPILVEDAASPFAGTFWSLLPPICAIVLALISKEVYSSLFFGCVIGALLYTQFSPWDTLTSLVGADYGLICVLADSWDMGIIIFLVELGIISDPRQMGGYPEYSGTPYVDTDQDGMPDQWEIEAGLNPSDPTDANSDCNGDGYTNIEKYINGINPSQKIDWRNLNNNYDTLAEKGKLM